MKKIWKLLAVAAAVSLIPYRAEEDTGTGERTVDALLWSLRTRPDGDGNKSRVLTLFPCRCPRGQGEPAFSCEEEARSVWYPAPPEHLEESGEPGPF